MKKKILITMFLCTISLFTVGSFPSYAKETPNTDIASIWKIENIPAQKGKTDTINPHSKETEWRYMTVNGKLFRRLYDLQNNCWIGNWELVP